MLIESPELQLGDNNSFYFRQISEHDSKSEIFQVKTLFSDYQPIRILCENSFSYDYVSFKVDIQQGMLLLFLKESFDSSKLFVKIVEILNPENIVLDCEIIDSELKGIFLSNQ